MIMDHGARDTLGQQFSEANIQDYDSDAQIRSRLQP
jgi:hypothetical protein